MAATATEVAARAVAARGVVVAAREVAVRAVAARTVAVRDSEVAVRAVAVSGVAVRAYSSIPSICLHARYQTSPQRLYVSKPVRP